MSAMSAMAAVAPTVQVRVRAAAHARTNGDSCFALFFFSRDAEHGASHTLSTAKTSGAFLANALTSGTNPGIRRGTRFASLSLTPNPPLARFNLPPPQARFGARSDKVVKARRAVVLNAVTEPETTAGADAPKPKPKRKFVKKNITVQDADIAIGNEYPGKVVRGQPRARNLDN